MQDRFVGDVGDFAKYGLLRAIRCGKRLGVAWYLHPDAGPNGDGRHTDYLRQPEKFRCLDCKLFDKMRKLRNSCVLSVKAVEKSGILGDAAFADDRLDIARIGVRDRDCWRHQWFERVKEKLAHCDLVFADPDNGLFPDHSFKPTRKEKAKRIPLAEAQALAEGRTVAIYHHNSRHKGGHQQEIHYWMDQLPGCTYAYYWRRWSNRTFFVINPDRQIEDRLKEFAQRWESCGELICERPKAPQSAPNS